jgi:hypothetical protein
MSFRKPEIVRDWPHHKGQCTTWAAMTTLLFAPSLLISRRFVGPVYSVRKCVGRTRAGLVIAPIQRNDGVVRRRTKLHHTQSPKVDWKLLGRTPGIIGKQGLTDKTEENKVVVGVGFEPT